MNNKYIGVHHPLKDGTIIDNLNEIKKYNGNLIQIFIGSPSKYYHSKYEFIKKYQLQSNEIKEYNKKNNSQVIIHCSYVNNIGNEFNKQKNQIKVILQELEIANIIGGLGCVLHSGKYTNIEIQNSKENMFYNIKYILKKIIENKWNVKLFIELNSGSGSDTLLTNGSLDSFIEFYNMFNNKYKKYFKLCIDTCHLFTSGYDINKINNIKKLYKEIKKKVGIENLGLIHFNNSKSKMGSLIDRHENIEEGLIKKENLYYIIKKFKKYNIPILLETPNDYKLILPKLYNSLIH
jgi:deoxyribonuclease-4